MGALTEAPHVNGRAVSQAQNNLRRTVETRLDVSVDPLVRETGAAEVYHLYRTVSALLEQDVLLEEGGSVKGGLWGAPS